MPWMRAFARTLPALSALLLALPLGCASEAGPQDEPPTLYKWVDQNGVAHYTTDPDRVPSNLRHRIRDLEDQPRVVSRTPREAGTEEGSGGGTSARAPDGSAPDVRRDAAEAEPAGGAPEATRADPARASEGSRAPEASGAPESGEDPTSGPERRQAGSEPRSPAALSDAPTAAGREEGEAVSRPALREAPAPTERETPEIAARTPGEREERRGAGARATPEAAAEGQADAAPRTRRSELDSRIAELEAELEAKEERLKALISETQAPAEGEAAPLYGNQELESLARSFPQIQADLAALRAERRRLERGR